MAYEPQPGTLPHRAIAWLRAQAKATGNPAESYSTAVICEALEADPTAFSSSMGRAKDSGAVKAERIPGRGMTFWWSLGSGEPAARALDEPADRTMVPTQRTVPAALAPRVLCNEAAPLPVLPPGELADESDPMPDPARSNGGRPMTMREITEVEERPAKPQPFDAWYSGVSGELVLQGAHIAQDGDVVLSKQQVRQLLATLSGCAT